MVASAWMWAVAVVAGVLPKRVWPRLDPLPMESASFASGLLTLVAGFAIGLDGFLGFAGKVASSTNSWMLRTLARSSANPYGVALVPYGTSVFAPFEFLLTPLGLLAVYLAASGGVRALSAWFGDPRGDFVLSAIFSTLASAAKRLARRGAHARRERLEGPDAPDVLRRGSWCGIDADFVVLSARRKTEWDAGAIVMTDADWYRLGVPFDMDTPAGLRTVYPLKKMDAAEVVRRGVRYRLPRLSITS
jgi:hypothetical protein